MAGSRAHDDPCELEQPALVMPFVEARERFGRQDQVQVRIAAGSPLGGRKPGERVDGVRGPTPVDLEAARFEARLAGDPRLHQREAVGGRAHRMTDLVRRDCGGDDEDPIEPELVAGRPSEGQMARMKRIECAAEDPDRPWSRRSRGRRNVKRMVQLASQGWASHSSSVGPIRTTSPGVTPARRSSSSMPYLARSR